MTVDELDDDQTMRALTLAIAAASGIATTSRGIMYAAKALQTYIETGEIPE